MPTPRPKRKVLHPFHQKQLQVLRQRAANRFRNALVETGKQMRNGSLMKKIRAEKPTRLPETLPESLESTVTGTSDQPEDQNLEDQNPEDQPDEQE